jgi:cellulose synthase/poly-beta-1,6-N-acetylglucosamine synthase-like glycosyltransferase
MKSPRLSVLIPVYRDWGRLRDCLAALAGQTWPADDFEIIAVNNDPAPPPPDFVLPSGVTLLHEPRGHSYAARNAGLAVSRGAVLAFTDADCRPEPDWLAEGWAALQGEAELAGGRITTFIERPGLVAEYDRLFAFPQEHYVRKGSSVTANLFVKRAVFDQVGPFNAAMQSSGDFEFCRRAGQAGFRLVYAPRAVVQHPARDRLALLLRKNRRVAGGWRRREFEITGRSRGGLWWTVLTVMLRPRPRYWWRLAAGTERTAGMPLAKRLGVMALVILLYYHFALSVLRAPPAKDQH